MSISMYFEPVSLPDFGVSGNSEHKRFGEILGVFESIENFPDLENIGTIEIQSVDQMLEKFSLEAIFKKEITKTSSTRDITQVLISVFYGSVLTAHINQIATLKIFFRKNLELILKGLQ